MKKTYKLGDLLKYEQPTKYLVSSTNYNDSFKIPVLTAGKTFILGYTNETNGIYKASKENPVIIFDDFTTSIKYVDFPFKAKSSAMKILSVSNNSLFNIKYIYYVMNNLYFNHTDHKRYWISEYSKIELEIPDIKEQNNIGNFLFNVDTKLSILKQEKSLTQDYKKGMMQKIFSQEIRFKNDDGSEFGEWGKKMFNDVFISIPSKKHQILSSKILKEGLFSVVDQGKSIISGYSNEENKLYDNGEVIVFGDHTTILKYINFKFIVGADGIKILKNKISNLKYLYYFLNFNKVKTEGYKRHFSILKQLHIYLPSLAEQQKIASFLSSIDTKIDNLTKEIEKVETFKKGVMQQIFA